MGSSPNRNLRNIGPKPPYGQIAHVWRCLASERRVRRTSSLDSVSVVTVQLPIEHDGESAVVEPYEAQKTLSFSEDYEGEEEVEFWCS